jgi:predicted transcriptional regulator
VQSIIGDCIITKILQKPVDELADQTINESSSTRERLQEYFSGLETASALRVENPQRYTTPISLADIRKNIQNFVPPQNFYYLKRNDQRFGFVFSVLDSYGLSKKSTQKRITSF